jgi:hypothetical protein
LLARVAEDRAESAPPPPAEEKSMNTHDDMQLRLKWLSAIACAKTWPAAARLVLARTRATHPALELNLLRDGSLRDTSPESLTRVANAIETDTVLAFAWRLLALSLRAPTLKRLETVAGAQGLLKLSDGDITEAMARLEAWKMADPIEVGTDDFFRSAETACRKQAAAVAADTPVCVRLLEQERWDDAFAWLKAETMERAGSLGIAPPYRTPDRNKQRIMIRGHVERLFAQRLEECGDLALGWQMLLCDPQHPETFNAVLPQLTWLLNKTATEAGRMRRLRDRLHVWWLAARGEWAGSKDPVSIFRIAERETSAITYAEDFPYPDFAAREEQPPAPEQPTVVVMRKDRAEERGLPQAWRDLRDVALPLVVCGDAAAVRERLQEEYPHAFREVAMLTQDLLSGEPVRIKPTLLLSQPGTGKTRMIRRLAELISPDLYVSRFDAASAFDGMYGGTPKGWSTAQASVPARAILASRTANPISLVDEICKAGTSDHNGNLWSAMTPMLERETSSRHRETGIDAELDLSHVIHLATANSVERLPLQLRDRMRVILIPTPTLAHLPRLAAIVLNELAIENDMYASHAIEPLAPDELEIIGRAWARERFSMRKLQRLVAATLEARDTCARRH